LQFCDIFRLSDNRYFIYREREKEEERHGRNREEDGGTKTDDSLWRQEERYRNGERKGETMGKRQRKETKEINGWGDRGREEEKRQRGEIWE
jgi:hypothetical protein